MNNHKFDYIIAAVMLLLGTLTSIFLKNNKNKMKGRMPWITSILASILSGVIGGMLVSVYIDNTILQYIAVAVFALSGEGGINIIKDYYMFKVKNTVNNGK